MWPHNKTENIPGAMLQLQIVHYHLVASAVACEIVFSYPTSSINIKTKLTSNENKITIIIRGGFLLLQTL